MDVMKPNKRKARERLIKLLRDAKAGSRELDLQIALYRGFEGNGFAGPLAQAMKDYPSDHESIAKWKGIPLWTTSVDAVLTIAPPSKYSNLAGFLASACFQRCIGDISDERLALCMCIYILEREGRE